MTTYTLVRHSGYDLGGKLEFEFAVEARAISGRQVGMVERRGGLLFDGYDAAAKAEMDENYPPEVKGLIPHVRGSFSTYELEGSPLYIPAREDALDG